MITGTSRGMILAAALAVVLTELLQNAVDHAFPDGECDENRRVIVGLERVGARLHLTVQDNGTGPPEDFDINTVTGLGLSIVKQLVEGHEGKIEVTSTLGEGTIFAVTLPAADQDA